MKAYHGSAVLQFDSATTGNAGSGVPVTVRINSTQALATIYDLDDVVIANPLTTDAKGNYAFKSLDDVYDIILNEGTGDESKLEKVQISEFIGLINDLSQAYEFATVVEMTVSTIEFTEGKVLIVTDTASEYIKTAGTSANIGSPDLAGGGYASLVIKSTTMTTSQFGHNDNPNTDVIPYLQAAHDAGCRDILLPFDSGTSLFLSTSIVLTDMIIRGNDLVLSINGGNIKDAILDGVSHSKITDFEALSPPVPIVTRGARNIVHRGTDTGTGQRYLVITEASNSGGYILYELESGNGPADYDANHGLVRNVGVTQVDVAFVCKNTWDFDSGDITLFGGNIEGTLYDTTGKFPLDSDGAAINTTINGWAVPVGGYIEYDVPADVASKPFLWNILHWTSTSSATDVDISVDGVVVDNFSAANSNNALRKREVSVTRENGLTSKLRITNNGLGTYYHVCANYFDLNEYNGAPIDTWKIYKNEFQWFDTTGASEYAMFVTASSKWCGSYHGGEISTYLRWRIDGIQVDPASTFLEGEFFQGNQLALAQRTTLADLALNTYSTTMWGDAGKYTFKANFQGSLEVDSVYTMMNTTNSDMTAMLSPFDKVLSTGATNQAIGNYNDIVQYELATTRFVRATTTKFDMSKNKYGGMQIWNNGSVYIKSYYGPINGNRGTINNLSFETTREFGSGKY